jgi:hypothetical protein
LKKIGNKKTKEKIEILLEKNCFVKIVFHSYISFRIFKVNAKIANGKRIKLICA